MKKKIGVDLGTSSIGIAVYKKREATSEEEVEYMLDSIESSIFDEPIETGTQASQTKNSIRRGARLVRRQVERRSNRHKKLRHLFPLLNITSNEISESRKQKPNIFELRAKAIEEKISLAELARVFAHLNNNRGYKGNLKSSAGTVSTNIKSLEEKLEEKKCKTLGQLWHYEQMHAGRNEAWKHQNKEQNGTHIKREMIENEFHLIWDEQAKYYELLTQKCPIDLYIYFPKIKENQSLKDIFFSAIFYQRPIRWNFDTVGNCPFMENEKRAPIVHPLFQEYRIAKKILDIKLVELGNKKNSHSLSMEQMQQLYALLNDPRQKLNENNEISYIDIYKHLNIDKNLRFNTDRRALDDDKTGLKANVTLNSFYKLGILDSFMQLRQLAQDKLMDFLSALTDYDILLDADEISLQIALKEIDKNITKELQNTVVDFIQNSLNPQLLEGKKLQLETGRASYSKPVLLVLKEGLLQGQTENSLLQEKYGHDTTKKAPCGKLAPLSTVITNNPIIDRVLGEYKTKMDYYIDPKNLPEQVIIETSRELKNSLAMRAFIEKQQKEYKTKNDDAKKELEKLKQPLSGKNILRYRLWVEGDKICPYCGQTMALEDALNTAEIDHIIPISQNGPNRYFNKVLCHQKCNNDKSGNTPYEAVQQNLINGDALQNFAEKIKEKAKKIKKRPIGGKWIAPLEKKDLEKKAELLLTSKTGEELFDFSDRSQNETAWISKIILDWSKDISRKKTVATRGALTAHLRHFWGLDTLLAEIRIEEGKTLFSKEDKPIPLVAYKELWLKKYPKDENQSYFYEEWQKEKQKNPELTLEEYRKKQKKNPAYQFNKRCDHRHHAIDAAIIGLCDHRMLQQASKAQGLKALRNKKGEIIHEGFYPDNPCPKLRNRLKQLLTDYVVWHKPDRFPNKAFFKESAYGVIKQNDTFYPFSRKPLNSFIDGKKDITAILEKNIVDGSLKEAILRQYKARRDEGLAPQEALLGKDDNDGIFYQKNKVKKIRCYLLGKTGPRELSKNFLLQNITIKGKKNRTLSFDTVKQMAENKPNGTILPIKAYDNEGYACVEFYPNAKKGEASKKTISVFEYQQKLKQYQKTNPKAKNLPLEEENIIRVFENETIYHKKEKQFYFVGSFHGEQGLQCYVTTEVKSLNKLKTCGNIKDLQIIRTRQQVKAKKAELQEDEGSYEQ